MPDDMHKSIINANNNNMYIITYIEDIQYIKREREREIVSKTTPIKEN